MLQADSNKSRFEQSMEYHTAEPLSLIAGDYNRLDGTVDCRIYNW
jgi:hypothetical protein